MCASVPIPPPPLPPPPPSPVPPAPAPLPEAAAPTMDDDPVPATGAAAIVFGRGKRSGGARIGLGSACFPAGDGRSVSVGSRRSGAGGGGEAIGTTSNVLRASSALRSNLSASPASNAVPSARWIAAVAATDRARSRRSDKVKVLRMAFVETPITRCGLLRVSARRPDFPPRAAGCAPVGPCR